MLTDAEGNEYSYMATDVRMALAVHHQLVNSGAPEVVKVERI